jgi:predicted phosphoribosyltransferase
MIFQNREHAARLLAEKLVSYRGKNPLILGIPRGAVPMARIIADFLQAELDVVLVHKLGAPGEPELAIGAVDETGKVYLSPYIEALGISSGYILQEKNAQLETLRRRRSLYTPLRPPVEPAGRIAIVVDDGIATGATMMAALTAVRAKGPAKLIAAFAVAPPETVRMIAGEADEVVYLAAPEDFGAVGRFFRDFSQVTDEEVIAILAQSGARHGSEEYGT